MKIFIYLLCSFCLSNKSEAVPLNSVVKGLVRTQNFNLAKPDLVPKFIQNYVKTASELKANPKTEFLVNPSYEESYPFGTILVPNTTTTNQFTLNHMVEDGSGHIKNIEFQVPSSALVPDSIEVSQLATRFISNRSELEALGAHLNEVSLVTRKFGSLKIKDMFSVIPVERNSIKSDYRFKVNSQYTNKENTMTSKVNIKLNTGEKCQSLKIELTENNNQGAHSYNALFNLPRGEKESNLMICDYSYDPKGKKLSVVTTDGYVTDYNIKLGATNNLEFESVGKKHIVDGGISTLFAKFEEAKGISVISNSNDAVGGIVIQSKGHVDWGGSNSTMYLEAGAK